MDLRCIKVLLVFLMALCRNEALFSRPSWSPPARYRFHLNDDDHVIFPKHATIKLVHHPISFSDKFSSFSKKPPKYTFGKLTESWKGFGIGDDEKNLEEVVLEEPFRPQPVSLPIVDAGFSFNSLHKPQFDDVKPVTEHIEGDLKYDFRTKTHSI